MSKLFWVLLLGLLLLTGFTARAQDEESGEGEEGNSEESNGEEAAKPKLDKLNKKAADKEVPLAPGLPPIKVEPLSADSPILKDDDGLFDTLQNNKILGSMESVERLTLSLKKAANLLRKMKLDVEGEKLWLKNVHEILQNYEFKYARTRKDVQKREAKIALLAKLVQELKGSVLQANVQQQLKNAKSALGELVSRSDNKKSKELTKIKQRIGRLQKSLAETRHSKPHSETAAQIHDILKSEVTPEAHDALSNLVALEVKAEVEEEDQAEEQVEQEESEEEESEEESEEEESEEESEEEESEEEVEEESTSNGKAQW